MCGNQSSDRSNVLQLVEMARMYSMIGEIHTASRMFLNAYDISCSNQYLKNQKSINEVQFKALVASIFDIG